MDILKLGKLEDAGTFNLKHFHTGKELTNDDGSPMTITAVGRHSNKYRRIVREIAKELQADGVKKLTDAQAEDNEIDLLARCIKDWEITFDGKKPEYSYKTARYILGEYGWIKDQVDIFVHVERDAFLSGASET